MYPNNKIKISFSLFLCLIISSLTSQNVEITISNIRSTEGQIIIAVFENQSDFEKETPTYSFTFIKENQKNGELMLSIQIPEGKWGISVLDDENFSNKMEYTLFNTPKEGFGFSNYYHTGLAKPKFENFKFIINKDCITKIKIRMRYL